MFAFTFVRQNMSQRQSVVESSKKKMNPNVQINERQNRTWNSGSSPIFDPGHGVNQFLAILKLNHETGKWCVSTVYSFLAVKQKNKMCVRPYYYHQHWFKMATHMAEDIKRLTLVSLSTYNGTKTWSSCTSRSVWSAKWTKVMIFNVIIKWHTSTPKTSNLPGVQSQTSSSTNCEETLEIQ